MSQLIFLFAVHNHQPVGNFTWVYEKAFRDCYKPFLKELLAHRSIKFTLHFSGTLWEYMQEKERECWEIAEEMVGRGQVELMGGGFYEPILSIIPEEDRAGQIGMMNQFLEENFKVKPRGLWLAERVWEPHLPKTLNKEGIEYTLLDEEHFHYVGIRNIRASYITEDEGYPLTIFPVEKKLRYMIPFRKLEEVKAYFQEIREKEGVAILGDDGEKFGLWPGTHEWVYEQGWLSDFLKFLETEEIQLLTCSDFMDRYPPRGKVYLPPSSYEEMMEWILEPRDYETFKRLKDTSPKEARRFLRGGIFREFFLKYPESNHLHSRMQLVSREVNSHTDEIAKKELYKGQCNDPYWHGIFGGLYLPHLREAAYSHLLKAENRLALKQGWSELDYDQDGKTEVMYRGPKFNLLIKPSFGGSIVEMDYKLFSRNLMDVLSRREESYHSAKQDENGEGKSIHELSKDIPDQAKDLLIYDRYPRFSLLDYFMPVGTTQEDLARLNCEDKGDFINREYQYVFRDNRVLLTRDGNVSVDGKRFSLRVSKEIATESNSVKVKYQLESLDSGEFELFFGSEWNLYLRPEEVEVLKDRALLFDGKLSFIAPRALEIWRFSLRTLSQSEKGYDIIHQGICLVPIWRLRFSDSKKYHLELLVREEYVK